jgi:hypothetical protein
VTTQTTGTSQTLQTGSTNTANNTTDVVNGYLRVKLAQDSINTDGILIEFNPTASAAYVPGEDAPSLQGFGVVSLASLSTNNVPLAINVMPLTGKGASIGLRVNVKSDGVYTLNMQQINAVPNTYSLWLMDGYKKDSLNMRLYPTYAFNVYKSDTTTFGSNRFKLVVRHQ